MGEGSSLVNLGELSKPATVLIEKISDAVGGLAAPWQIRRVAQAEADAETIKALTKVRSDLTLRALDRFIKEEARKQQNMESITRKAIPSLEPTAAPEKLDDDWIVNFFDKCRLISDSEMQQLWAKVLAGEANAPGHYSRRTVNYLSSLDKTDAQLFATLCSFGWVIGVIAPLIYDLRLAVYKDRGIDFDILTHLDDIGLVSFDNVGRYKRMHLPQKLTVSYYGQLFALEFSKPEDNELDIGAVLLSKAGQELAQVCGSQPVPEFPEYVLQRWAEQQVNVTKGQRAPQ